MSNQSTTPSASLVRASVMLPPGHGNMHDWMDRSQPYVKVYSDVYGLNLVDSPDKKTATYFQIPSSTHAALCKATTELHSMFVKATEHVCKTPELWPAFGFPSQYWPRALASFYVGDKVISGRFDFSITPENGIKCFEYNADSASCLMECAYVQASWAKAVGIDSVGVDAGIGCEERLVNAWHLLNLPKGTLVHFLIDPKGEEETLHALYMMNAAQRAGLECKLVKCASEDKVDNFTFDEAGYVLDNEKKRVRYVWKTWCYTTLFSQWNGEPLRHSGQVRVIDVCLNEDVLVFEPWWSAIPANKAILPVLSEMFPDHPNLLHTSWELTDRLKKTGYVAKPVNGRGGKSIMLHGPVASSEPEVVESAVGKFIVDQYVYQELCKPPVIDNEYIQVNTFCVAGHYGGTVLRVSKSPIISYESSVDALRVVDDGTGTPLPTDEIANPYHHRKYISEKELDKVLPVETVEETDGRTLAGMPAPFGAVMGYALGGIPAYSCDYDTADRTVFSSRVHFRHKLGKIYYGARYQCVEFTRRWLIHATGVTISEVGMAYDIFDMPHAIRVKDEEKIPWTNIPNGSSERPVPGAVLIWNEGGEFKYTGHVAIVMEVSDEWVRVAEQNVDDIYWPHGQNWARQLAVEYDKAKGTYFIREVNGSVKGWKHLPKDFVWDPVPLPTYDTTIPL